MKRTFGLHCLLVAVWLSSCASPDARPLILATTTSVGNSGLLDALMPAIREDLGLDLRAHLVGSGRSLQMLEQGDADVVISHAPQHESTALARHPDWKYRKLMFNDFVIVGAPGDPARVAQASSAAQAMRMIAARGERFASRGDSSGTFEREQSLWQAAGAHPSPANVVTTGQGMAATIRVASAISAYTLADRATFDQLAPVLDLKILFQKDPALLNSYAVVTRSDYRDAELQGAVSLILNRAVSSDARKDVRSTGLLKGDDFVRLRVG